MLKFVLRSIRLVFRSAKYALGILLFFFLIQRSTYPLWLNWNAVSVVVLEHQFDYVQWEINALAAKTAEALWGSYAFMDEAARSQYVRDYMTDLDAARQLEGQIQVIYTDPAVEDPDAATADLRQQRDDLRADLNKRQSLAESILEGQVSVILVEEGFGTLGQVLPPVSMRFTQMPNLLVVSPRGEIRRAVELAIDPLPLEDIIELETRIEDERDMASLVIPLGGMALYPAMIQETTSIQWAVETFAHEWVHHYFFFFPLGLNYFSNTAGFETITINETSADIFGKEIREKVLQRFYPELAQQAGLLHVSEAQQNPFDFGRAMHITRVIVDKSLADIQAMDAKVELLHEHGLDDRADAYAEEAAQSIEQMEAYMEQRRTLFYENGYRIRKLNQAYFAFYGGYQAGDRPGVGGADPIGPAVHDIRALSGSLHDFVVTMRDITSRDELLSVRDAMSAAGDDA